MREIFLLPALFFLASCTTATPEKASQLCNVSDASEKSYVICVNNGAHARRIANYAPTQAIEESQAECGNLLDAYEIVRGQCLGALQEIKTGKSAGYFGLRSVGKIDAENLKKETAQEFLKK